MARLMRSYSVVGVVESIGELKVDWLETDKAHIIQLDVPGLHKEELSFQVLPGNIFQISGAYLDVAEEGEMLVGNLLMEHIRERPRGSFIRQFKLPLEVDLGLAQVTDDAGVITISLPKRRRRRIVDIPILVSKY